MAVCDALAHNLPTEAHQAQEALQAERAKSEELQKDVQQLQQVQGELSQRVRQQESSISSLEAERNTLYARAQELDAALASTCEGYISGLARPLTFA